MRVASSGYLAVGHAFIALRATAGHRSLRYVPGKGVVPMIDTSARLLKLLSLLQTRKMWNGSELAERLQVSGRTVRNDIDRLRELGYPVDATRGGQGGYQLGAGAELPPLLLDDEEAVAIV